jgi:hypothetical protein
LRARRLLMAVLLPSLLQPQRFVVAPEVAKGALRCAVERAQETDVVPPCERPEGEVQCKRADGVRALLCCVSFLCS